MRLVLDTNVILSARRSFEGASNALLRAVGERRITMLASVPLFMEYEAVLNRPEQLLAMKMAPEQVSAFLDALAGMIQPVKLHYLWRPQLSDVADEMVLETAINGRADAVVTFNTRHFGPARQFGVDVSLPSEIMRRLP